MNNKEAALKNIDHQVEIILNQMEEAHNNGETPWTAKEKKSTIVTTMVDETVDGEVIKVERRVPIRQHLRERAAILPPMMRGKHHVVHFDNLWWYFMHGRTKEESQRNVNDYCRQMIDIAKQSLQEEDVEQQKEEACQEK